MSIFSLILQPQFEGKLSKIMDLLKIAQEQLVEAKSWPEFRSGDTITVYYKIKEGNKEREQQFQGVVLLYARFPTV